MEGIQVHPWKGSWDWGSSQGQIHWVSSWSYSVLWDDSVVVVIVVRVGKLYTHQAGGLSGAFSVGRLLCVL